MANGFTDSTVNSWYWKDPWKGYDNVLPGLILCGRRGGEALAGKEKDGRRKITRNHIDIVHSKQSSNL